VPARANTSGGTRTVSLSPADATLGKRRDKEARALYLNAVLQCSAGLVAAPCRIETPSRRGQEATCNAQDLRGNFTVQFLYRIMSIGCTMG
jgi:hypothetical protein